MDQSNQFNQPISSPGQQPSFQPEGSKKKKILPSWASIFIVVIAAIVVISLISWATYQYFVPSPGKLPVGEEKSVGKAPLVPDLIIADVTVTSIALTDVCPSHEEVCPTETNPDDSGEIRIDHIITYRRGDAAAKQDDPGYTRLTEGETKEVEFSYSARPAKVRYELPQGREPVEGPPNPSGPSVNPQEGQNITVESGPPGPDILIPRENGYFIYTFSSEDPNSEVLMPYNIEVGDETILPGLEVGDKIRVYFYYSTPTGGPLEIREYIDAICVNEGDTFEIKFGFYCCEGLNRISMMELQEGQCVSTAPPSVFICANCGNGECGVGENICNCPEDCK